MINNSISMIKTTSLNSETEFMVSISAKSTVEEHFSLFADGGISFHRYLCPAENKTDFDMNVKTASINAIIKDTKKVAESDLIAIFEQSGTGCLTIILKDDCLEKKHALYTILSKYEDMGWDIQILYKRNAGENPEQFEVN